MMSELIGVISLLVLKHWVPASGDFILKSITGPMNKICQLSYYRDYENIIN